MNSLYGGDNPDILNLTKHTILLLFAILILPFQLAHSQTNPEEFFKKGTELYRNQNYKEAAGEFTKAIAAKPDYAEAYYNLGITYWTLGECQKAIKALEKVKELAPNSEVAKKAESDIKKLSSFIEQEKQEQETEEKKKQEEKNIHDAANTNSNIGSTQISQGSQGDTVLTQKQQQSPFQVIPNIIRTPGIRPPLKLEDIESGTTGDQEETGGDRQPVRQGEP